MKYRIEAEGQVPAYMQLYHCLRRDIADGVYGIICAPPVFTIAKSQAGVTPATVEIGGKQYLTDGVMLIEIDESAGS